MERPLERVREAKVVSLSTLMKFFRFSDLGPFVKTGEVRKGEKVKHLNTASEIKSKLIYNHPFPYVDGKVNFALYWGGGSQGYQKESMKQFSAETWPFDI
ncbi:hypothetical protein AVEN_205124-1 [Araneus ventricosus]|uniref:Uncharacterized protein n=1 Tax=Araneus ventricosus TaxID=182803 RepID=A0A4Y2GCU9_ARAVE|nr:hypothetical protein AVEN_205124-1 [Araneus ventricosus]